MIFISDDLVGSKLGASMELHWNTIFRSSKHQQHLCCIFTAGPNRSLKCLGKFFQNILPTLFHTVIAL